MSIVPLRSNLISKPCQETQNVQTSQNPERQVPEALHPDCNSYARQKSPGHAHARRHPPLAVPCYSPLKAYRPLSDLDGGRLVFNAQKAKNPDNPTTVPCGQCIGCRVDRSRDWAMRCYHEAQMHPLNTFINLTFNDEHLPEDYSVHVKTWQLFMYKLRQSLPQKIRFFACGEYGDLNLRPHYHALIFNHIFPDQKFYKKTPQQHNLYTSETLTALWGHGFCTIGDVNYQSAAYVARYIMKKINGHKSVEHYTRIHPLTGLPVTCEPEFCVQSRRPGIGATWFDKFKSDAFPSDFLIVDGKKHPVPKFYLRKLQKEEPPAPTSTYFKEQRALESNRIKRARHVNALPRKADNTPERLAVREIIKKSKLKTLKREL